MLYRSYEVIARDTSYTLPHIKIREIFKTIDMLRYMCRFSHYEAWMLWHGWKRIDEYVAEKMGLNILGLSKKFWEQEDKNFVYAEYQYRQELEHLISDLVCNHILDNFLEFDGQTILSQVPKYAKSAEVVKVVNFDNPFGSLFSHEPIDQPVYNEVDTVELKRFLIHVPRTGEYSFRMGFHKKTNRLFVGDMTDSIKRGVDLAYESRRHKAHGERFETNRMNFSND